MAAVLVLWYLPTCDTRRFWEVIERAVTQGKLEGGRNWAPV